MSSVVLTDGNDRYKNEDDNVTISALGGNDNITNSGREVSIDAAAGDDTVNNGDRNTEGGNDVTITGGIGNDYIFNRGSDAEIDAGAGDDIIGNGDGNTAGGDYVKIVGGDGNDSVYNRGSDVSIDAGAGDDTVNNGDYKTEGGSYVSISSGDGNDRINNYGSNATIDAGAGHDVILNGNKYSESSSNNVEITAGAGNDRIISYGSTVTVDGGDGIDRIDSYGSDVSINGGAGNDVITNNATKNTATENVTISGGAGDDRITNYNGDYMLIDGGAGLDYIKSTGSDVSISGGADNDSIESTGSNVSISGDAGNDSITSTGDNVTVDGGAGKDYIKSTGDNVKLLGGEDNDSIIGTGLNVTVDGGAGDDYIVGGYKYYKNSDISIGYTSLVGGDGNDTIIGNGSYYSKGKNETTESIIIDGGAGNDSIVSGKGGEMTIRGGAGLDTIRVLASYSSIDGGDGNDKIFVRGEGNSVKGGAGNDYISAVGRNGTVNGGAGDDSIDVRVYAYSDRFGSLDNIIKYTPGEGNDTIHVVASSSATGGNLIIRLTDGTLGETSASSNGDIIINVGSNKLTLKEALGEQITIQDSQGVTLGIINEDGRTSVETSGKTYTALEANHLAGYYIYNTIASAKVTAANSNDAIFNEADRVSLDGGKGHDVINSTGNNVSINGGAGSNNIESHGNNATILGGEGDDYIESYGDDSKLTGGEGNNNITNYGKNVSITAGAGDDVIYNYANSYYDEENWEEKYTYPDNVTINAGNGDNYIQNQGSNVKITAGTGDDDVTNNGSNVSISTGAGDDSIENLYSQESGKAIENVTIDAGDGDNSIESAGAKISIKTGAGDDTIVNNQYNVLQFEKYEYDEETGESYYGHETIYLEDVTINAGDGNNDIQNYSRKVSITTGTGDDTILNLSTYDNKASDEYGNEEYLLPDDVKIAAGDGDNYIENHGRNVSITAGKGNDSILNSYNSEIYTYNEQTWNEEYYYPDNVSITAGDGDNYIENTGSNVSITAGAGADTVANIKSNVTINTGAGDDSIVNGVFDDVSMMNYSYDYNPMQNVEINAGEGNNDIRNKASNVKITTGSGDDSIVNGFATYSYWNDETEFEETVTPENVSISAGEGDNYIVNYNRKVSITAGDGDDYIVNTFNRDFYTYDDEGNEKYFTPDSVTIDAGDGDNYIENTGKDVTITTGTGNDTISLSGTATGNVINYHSGNDVIYGINETTTLIMAGGTFSSVKGEEDIVLTVDGKTISLIGAAELSDINVEFQLLEGAWSVKSGKAAYMVDGEAKVTISGLSTGAKVTDFSISGDTVTVGKNALGTSAVSVSGDFKLALGSDVTTDENVVRSSKWNVASGKATYQQTTPTHYEISEDGKSITYAKEATATLTTVSGLDRNAKAADFSVNGNTITIADNALGTSAVSVTGDYKLALGSDVTSTVESSIDLTVKGGKATYQQVTPEYYTLANDEKSITYSKKLTTTVATISGLDKKATEEQLTRNGDTVTIGKDALGASKISVSGNGNYKLALGEGVVSTVEPSIDLTVKGGKATYQQVTPEYYTLANDKKSIVYNKKAATTVTTVSGLDKNAKESDLSLSGNTITISDNALGTSKVSVTGDYKLALGEGVVSTVEPSIDLTVKGGKATYQQVTPEYYTLANDKKSIVYNKKAATTVATISGLDKNAKEEQLTRNGDTVTIGKDALGASKVSVSGTGNYKLALGEGVVTSGTTNAALTLKGTTATYKGNTNAYYTLANEKTINYTKEKIGATIATISGLSANVKESDLTLNGTTVTLAANALNADAKKKTVVKGDYTLAIDDSLKTATQKNIWTNSGTTATYSAGTTGYFTLASDNKTISYSAAKAGTTPIITLTNLNNKTIVPNADGTITGITLDESAKTVTLSNAVLNKKVVDITGDYTLILGSDVTERSTVSDAKWTHKGTADTLAKTTSKGYSLASDTKITYANKLISTTLATVKGTAKALTESNYDEATNTVTLANSDLATSHKVTISGTTKFNFASDFSKATITGSALADTLAVGGDSILITAGKGDDSISVTGSNVSINAGAGNDYVDMGSGSNLFLYAAGEGNDTIGGFSANDTIKVTKGTVTTAKSGNNVILTVTQGNIKGTITLTDAVNQSFSVYNSKNVSIASYAASSADVISENYFDESPQLGEILGASYDAISMDEFGTSYDATQLAKQTVVYGAKK